ncbi:hypothetical protein [Paenibacillus silvae]|uniref:hypothetical protein n=1 Tax=Paenibacillus silvae TaxID=1325358 RepID=UPI0020047BA6|nr:hypothetical protein [Paenibacillus silvae]MCK6075380.1 hypothetical protein [Paenibacillus silvae]MCK6149767.1 hypothetical protein [Paenibacillus silvae]MCK6268065.1 hypothetical protein [Paenibacillus silvae]
MNLERDFNYYIHKYGEAGARIKFEEACFVMLKAKFKKNVHPIKAHPGDEGIDIYVGNITRKIDVYQCKFYMTKLNHQTIKESFLRAANNNQFSMNSWTLIVPKNLTLKEAKWWDEWKIKMEAKFNLEIDIMSESGILSTMRQVDVYKQLFDLESSIQLKEIHEIITQKHNGKAEKKFNFLANKIIEYISHRINVFRELYFNSYNIKEYFEENNITSFLELFQQSDIRVQHLFNEIEKLIQEISKEDIEIGYLCSGFVFMQEVYIQKIEEDLQYTDEYLFNLKSYSFQTSLQKIIWDLSKEEHTIRTIINKDKPETELVSQFDMRDTIIPYKNKQDLFNLLALHVLTLQNNFQDEDFEVFYGKEDERCLNFALISPYMRYSNTKTPYPSGISKMINYIQMRFSKFNDKGEYTFHIESTNIILFEELDTKSLQKLHDIKKTANVKYHHFIKENKVQNIVKKFNHYKIDHKVISLVEEPKYYDKINLLLNDTSELNNSEIITGTTIDGSIVASNGYNFIVRKLKKR